jgi:hypothetical protein
MARSRRPLHDHAHLFVNGVAINEGLLDDAEARAVAERLLDLLDREGPPDLRAGLPGNVRVVPDDRIADVFPGMGFGFYESGAQALSRRATSSRRCTGSGWLPMRTASPYR